MEYVCGMEERHQVKAYMIKCLTSHFKWQFWFYNNLGGIFVVLDNFYQLW